MDTNLVIQYSVVALLLIGALVWIVVKAVKAKKTGASCCGCSLSETCSKARHPHPEASAPPRNCCSDHDGCHCQEKKDCCK